MEVQAAASVPASSEWREILTFMRQENDANRKAARDDADATRKLLTETAKVVSYPLTAAIAIAVFLGYKDFSGLQKNLTDLETRQISEFVRDTRPTIMKEVAKKVDDEVGRPEIQNVIRDDVERSPAVNETIRTQIQSRLPELSKAADAIVSKATGDLRREARSASPTGPTPGRTEDERVQALVGRPIKLTAFMKNVAQD